jgi:hypothetical protein
MAYIPLFMSELTSCGGIGFTAPHVYYVPVSADKSYKWEVCVFCEER